MRWRQREMRWLFSLHFESSTREYTFQEIKQERQARLLICPVNRVRLFRRSQLPTEILLLTMEILDLVFICSPGRPTKMSGTPVWKTAPAPALGQDNAAFQL